MRRSDGMTRNLGAGGLVAGTLWNWPSDPVLCPMLRAGEVPLDMTVDVKHVLTILAVKDLLASVEFYRSAFDWTPTIETPVYVEFTLNGEQRIGLYAREAFGRNTGLLPTEIPAGAITPTEIYFYSDHLSATIEKIKQAGARELSALAPKGLGR